jgi:hypothetical protein
VRATLTPSRRAAIIALRDDGLTLKAVAESVQCSTATVKRVLAAHDPESDPLRAIDPLLELERAIRSARPGSAPHVAAIRALVDFKRNPPPVLEPGDELGEHHGIRITLPQLDGTTRIEHLERAS